MNKIKKTEKEFHAVEYMRKVREEMSNLYNTDKKRYFEEIKQAMEDFKHPRGTQMSFRLVGDSSALIMSE